MTDAPPVIDIDGGTDDCTVTLMIPPGLDCLRGHFPGAPVVPGVVLVGWALALGARHLGTPPECREMEALKFHRVLRPGQAVTLTMSADRARHRLHFSYRDGETLCASGWLRPRYAGASGQAEGLPPLPECAPVRWPITELIPHRDGMVLLDALAACAADYALCRYQVPARGLLHDADGMLPAWAGMELMAQAAAAWAGCRARLADEQVRRGFLLGTRHYACNVAGFAPGSELAVHACRVFHDAGGMSMFTCHIDAPGVVATARLAVFSPPAIAPSPQAGLSSN